MQNYYQNIICLKDDTLTIKTISHDKPLSDQGQKLQALRKYLYKKYGVFSFTELKERGPALVAIKKEAFKALGIKSTRV